MVIHLEPPLELELNTENHDFSHDRNLIKERFADLRHLPELEFNLHCSEKAQVKDPHDMGYISSVPCLNVGKVKTPWRVDWHYILFYSNNQLHLGILAEKVQDMKDGDIVKKRLQGRDIQYYVHAHDPF